MSQEQEFLDGLIEKAEVNRVSDPDIRRFEEIDISIDQFLNGCISRYQLRIKIIAALCTEYK